MAIRGMIGRLKDKETRNNLVIIKTNVRKTNSYKDWL